MLKKPTKKIFKTLNTYHVSQLCQLEDEIVVSISFGDSGNIYFTTNNSEKLWKIHKDGELQKPILVASQPGSIFGGLTYSSKENTLYICDTAMDSHRLWTYSIGTGTLSILECSETKKPKYSWEHIKDEDNVLHYAQYVVAKDDNCLYVTDFHRLQKLDLTTGLFTTIAGSLSMDYKGAYRNGHAMEALFDHPTGFTFGKDGTIYVADTHNGYIRKIKDGKVTTVAASRHTNDPWDVILDGDGTLLVCDREYPLKKIDEEKNTVTCYEIPGIVSDEVFCFRRGLEGPFYFGTKDAIMKVSNPWMWERYLWIAKLKEDVSYCALAGLPLDLIRTLAILVRKQEERLSSTKQALRADTRRKPQKRLRK